MFDQLALALRAGKAYPTLPAQTQHHTANEGANTGAQSALPTVPGHTVPAGDTTPIAIKGSAK